MNFSGGFDKIYWLFIYAAVIFHVVAGVLTAHALSTNTGKECINLSSTAFSLVGIYWWIILTSLFLISIMIFIPYLMEENERIGIWATTFLLIIVLAMAFDAVNDIAGTVGIYWLNDLMVAIVRMGYTSVSTVTGTSSGFDC